KSDSSKKNAERESAFEVCHAIEDLDKQMAKHLISEATHEGFNAAEGQTYITSTLGLVDARSIALLGMGDPHEQSIDLFRRAGGEAYKIAHDKRAQKLSFIIPKTATIPFFDVVTAISDGIRLASYKFDRYQTTDKSDIYLKEVDFHLPSDPT